MQREEVEEQVIKTISNMNLFGLEIVQRFVNGMDKVELCNINTAPERVAELQKLSEQKEAEWKAREEERQTKDLMERMKLQIDRRKAAIASLTGKEKKFWEEIEKVQSIDIKGYELYSWQIMLISDLYDNNYIEASYTQFLYGFYQGMRYMKNKAKKRGSKTV